jgi:hypothetical protein
MLALCISILIRILSDYPAISGFTDSIPIPFVGVGWNVVPPLFVDRARGDEMFVQVVNVLENITLHCT